MRFVGGACASMDTHLLSITHPDQMHAILAISYYSYPADLFIYLFGRRQHAHAQQQQVSDGTTSGAEQDARARSAHAFLLIGSSLKIYSSEAASIHVRYLNLNYRIGDNYITLVNYMMMHVDSIIC